MTEYKFPAFDDLPKVPGQPQGTIWGFFDKDGQKDQIGTVNLLTEAVVRKARDEIQTGKHVQLDWPLHNMEYTGFGRAPMTQVIKDMAPEGFVGYDDIVTINTQAGSQWDSLKHWADQHGHVYYNGWKHDGLNKIPDLGMHNVVKRGGIVGRGVLVDWLGWWEKTKTEKPPSAVSRYEIPVSEIEETLKFQGTELRQGDILILRTGFVRWHNNADTAERIAFTKRELAVIGIQNNEATVRWLYDQHAAAVAADTLAFEAWPYAKECCLHEWLLVRWGTHIGELWNLEQLAEECTRQKRWSFFFTSAPLHVIGGVASPPNAIAIF